MPAKKEIIYPMFLECCKFTLDSFWENVFEDLAYGVTPYGAYISKDFLCCSYKNKEFSYKIEKKPPIDLYKDVYKLLGEKLGILSYKEKLQKRVDFYQTESRIKKTREEWCNIKKKNIKDLLIEKYVIDMKKKYNLSIKQAKFLLSIIFISMVFKVITSKDIVYSDGRIQNIESINFDKISTTGLVNIVLTRNIYDTEVNLSPEIVGDKKLMNEEWDKYLSNLKI